MNPGCFCVGSWLPPFQGAPSFPDRLTIYDRGDIQGWLIEEATGKSTWIVFSVELRYQTEDGTITETCEILPETSAPLHYHSIESFPLRRVRQQQQDSSHFLFSLPQARVLLTVSEPLPELPSLQQQPLPSPLPSQGRAGPESHGPRKLDSSKPIDARPQFQRRNKESPTGKALSSSNPSRHGQPSKQDPKKQEALPQRSPPTHHTGRGSPESPPWTTLAQQSLYSRPPPEVEAEVFGQA